MAAFRCSVWPDRLRANVASAMPVIGTPRSRALCTVQRPVPFCSAASSTTSTNGLPVAASVCSRTSAVSSIRNDSRSPPFHSRKTSAISPGERSSTLRSRSKDSAISCMSAYSMPLCTIFTKCPAPSVPTWVQHGVPSTCAAMDSITGPSRA